MDNRIQKADEVNERGFEVQRNDIKKICKNKAGRKQEPYKPEIVEADFLPILLNHYFPGFNQLLEDLVDPRDPDLITYSLKHEIYLGLLMFLSHAGSRRQFDSDKETEGFKKNFNKLINENNDFTAKMDTVFYLLEKMNPQVFSEIPGKLVGTLIEKKVLEKYRFNGDYLIAIDGTEVSRSKKQHCDKCLVQKHRNGTIDYFHTVLEAKLITKDGLSLSLASVFVENESTVYDKQDCELKAFYRLEKILKKKFPRLRMCILMDSLYANEKVLEIFEKNSWNFFVAFKGGSIPTLYKEAFNQIDKNSNDSVVITNKNDEREYHSWTSPLKYRSLHVNVVNVDIYHQDEEGSETEEITRFVYLTNSRPSKENIVELNNYGGRQRSKIEESFNVQKNNGYKLEHNYGAQGFAYKNCYILIQIAHLLHQLIYNSDINGKLTEIKLWEDMPNATKALVTAMVVSLKQTWQAFSSLKDFAKRFGESMRYKIISDFALGLEFASSIQIRLTFDTS